jgi:hypothetical protein
VTEFDDDAPATGESVPVAPRMMTETEYREARELVTRLGPFVGALRTYRTMALLLNEVDYWREQRQ